MNKNFLLSQWPRIVSLSFFALQILPPAYGATFFVFIMYPLAIPIGLVIFLPFIIAIIKPFPRVKFIRYFIWVYVCFFTALMLFFWLRAVVKYGFSPVPIRM